MFGPELVEAVQPAPRVRASRSPSAQYPHMSWIHDSGSTLTPVVDGLGLGPAGMSPSRVV